MDAVRAADRRRHLVLVSAALQRGEQRVDVGDQDVARPLQLHGEAGVEHVRARHALMDEARIRADELGEMGEEGDHVVLGDALDLVDALDVELRLAALLPDRLRRLLRDDAEFGQRVAGVGLDLEPDAEARLGRPDRGHLGAGIAGDHRSGSRLVRLARGSIGTGGGNRGAISLGARGVRRVRPRSASRGPVWSSPCRRETVDVDRSGGRDRRRLRRARASGAGADGRDRRSARRGGGRDELRQHRDRPERGDLPLPVPARAGARSRAPR